MPGYNEPDDINAKLELSGVFRILKRGATVERRRAAVADECRSAWSMKNYLFIELKWRVLMHYGTLFWS